MLQWVIITVMVIFIGMAEHHSLRKGYPMKVQLKRICAFLLALVLTGSWLLVAAEAEVYELTVVGVEELAGGDVEVGTDLSTILPASPQRDGYRFTGWVVTNSAGKIIQTPTVMPAYDVTFTAQWQINNAYCLTFLTQTGEVISKAEYEPGEPVSIPSYTPPQGMQLTGWRDARTGRAQAVPSVMPEQDMEYLAIITKISYGVVFMDGNTELQRINTDYGKNVTIIEPAAQAGKVFLGWGTSPDAQTPTYSAGDQLQVTENVTLYALWSLVQPDLALRNATLSFRDEIMMNIYFQATDLDNVIDMGLITYSSEVSYWSVDNAEKIISGAKYSTSYKLYYVTTEGIPAKKLGDSLWFAVYAQLSDGSYVYTKLVSYSPRDYARSILGDSSSGDEIKALVVAMLNYGAAAQTYFEYRTDDLVNSFLTAQQQALVEEYRADMMDTVPAASAQKQGAFANNGGYVRRYPSVTFGTAFTIKYYYTPQYEPVDGIKMYYWDAAAFEAADVLTAENATGCMTMNGKGTGQYHAAVTGIAAKDLDKGVYVAFCYSDGTTDYASGVLEYSIGTYCVSLAENEDAFAPLARATVVYGYYAKNYFA